MFPRGRFKYDQGPHVKIQAKTECPLFIFGQRESQTNMRRGCKPIAKNLSLVFALGCGLEQLEADVLLKKTEAKAAILERTYWERANILIPRIE